MFQDHATVNSMYKESFMHFFMGLVAEKLFGIQGRVLDVKRSNTSHQIHALGQHETHLIGGHIHAAHDTGKILILYRNLPHKESFEDYDELIKNTGKGSEDDVQFIYIGDHVDRSFCSKLRGTLQENLKHFYGEEAASNGSSAAAEETNEGNGNTKALMVSRDGDDEDAAEKSRNVALESLAEVHRFFTQKVAKEKISSRIRSYHERNELHKQLDEKNKRAEAQRPEAQRLLSNHIQRHVANKKHIKNIGIERAAQERWKELEEARKQREEDRAKKVHADAGSVFYMGDDDDLR